MDMIEIKNERLTAVLSTHGAELQSLRDQNGVERIWQGDPAFWTGHAPVLFPVAGALRLYAGRRALCHAQARLFQRHGLAGGEADGGQRDVPADAAASGLSFPI